MSYYNDISDLSDDEITIINKYRKYTSKNNETYTPTSSHPYGLTEEEIAIIESYGSRTNGTIQYTYSSEYGFLDFASEVVDDVLRSIKSFF